VTFNKTTQDRAYLNRALEASIHIGLTALVAAACVLILRPFIPLIAWGIIISVALYPSFCKLQSLLGGRAGLAAMLCTLALLTVLIVPALLLTRSLVDGIQSLAAHAKNETTLIPPPPPGIESWPIVGAPLKNAWDQASKGLPEMVRHFAPQIKAEAIGLLSASAAIGFTVVQLLLSILVAGLLLWNADAAYNLTCSLANRLFGDRGPEFQQLVGATIRSVTLGIIGVAVIQTAFATLGFLVVGLPGAGLWAVVFLFAAVLQVGIFVLVLAATYVFVTASATKAVIFLIWCIIVGLMDNVLKPLLLGRGVAVPIAVVFLGAIGGFVAMKIIGLFVGAIIMSVGYKLFLAWLQAGDEARPASDEARPAA
jgi:predicted PurR-regulated permease PerM